MILKMLVRDQKKSQKRTKINGEIQKGLVFLGKTTGNPGFSLYVFSPSTNPQASYCGHCRHGSNQGRPKDHCTWVAQRNTATTIWLFNIAMENPNHKWRFIAGKIIYFYGLFSMAMLNNQRVIPKYPAQLVHHKLYEPGMLQRHHCITWRMVRIFRRIQ